MVAQAVAQNVLSPEEVADVFVMELLLPFIRQNIYILDSSWGYSNDRLRTLIFSFEKLRARKVSSFKVRGQIRELRGIPQLDGEMDQLLGIAAGLFERYDLG